MRWQPEEKERFVRTVFDTIAPRYDFMNRVITGGAWCLWQRAFRRHAGLGPGDRVLDVGCGTGDLTLLAARLVGPQGRVVGVDLSPEMLAVARRKVERAGLAERIELAAANALDLPFPAAAFDAVISGFVLRNLADLDRGLAEMARVLRPGGRAAILEVSHPRHPLVALPFRLYFTRLVPLLGAWAARGWRGPVAPYAWLPASWRSFPDAAALAARMRAAGFAAVHWLPLTGGIACLHLAEKGVHAPGR